MVPKMLNVITLIARGMSYFGGPLAWPAHSFGHFEKHVLLTERILPRDLEARGVKSARSAELCSVVVPGHNVCQNFLFYFYIHNIIIFLLLFLVTDVCAFITGATSILPALR
jgi:hypothetical protein